MLAHADGVMHAAPLASNRQLASHPRPSPPHQARQAASDRARESGRSLKASSPSDSATTLSQQASGSQSLGLRRTAAMSSALPMRRKTSTADGCTWPALTCLTGTGGKVGFEGTAGKTLNEQHWALLRSTTQ